MSESSNICPTHWKEYDERVNVLYDALNTMTRFNENIRTGKGLDDGSQVVFAEFDRDFLKLRHEFMMKKCFLNAGMLSTSMFLTYQSKNINSPEFAYLMYMLNIISRLCQDSLGWLNKIKKERL